jgi:hypothetical protein
MDVTLLLKYFIGLVILLSIALFFFLYSRSNKKKQIEIKEKKSKPKKIEFKEFDEYLSIIKNKATDTQTLQQTVDDILKYYGTIPAKLGIRVHPEYYKYEEVLLRLCRHKNTNKNIIISFYKQLLKKNPKYAKEINDALTKGLNSLGM